MPPSSPSDDTPAWIKGDLPRDLPEPAPATSIEEAASPAEGAGLGGGAGELVDDPAGLAPELPDAAGATESLDGPAGAPMAEGLAADIADRLAEMDSVLNDADEMPATPGVAEIDEDLDDELDAAEDDGLPPTAGELADADVGIAEMREADIAERLAELDVALNDADELPGTPAVAEIDEDLEDELDAAEDEAGADETSDDEDEDEDAELVEGLEVVDDEDDEDQDDEDEEDDEDAELVEGLEVVEDEDDQDQDDEDEEDDDDDGEDDELAEALEVIDDEDDDDQDDDNDDEGEGLEPDEAEDAAALEATELDEVLIVELDEAAAEDAAAEDSEAEPAGETGLPEGAFLAELAEADSEADNSPELTETVIKPEEAPAGPEEAPALAMTGEAEPGTVPVLVEALRGTSEPGEADERPAAPASVVEALPPIEPPVVEDLNLEALIESLLFVADGAVPVGRLAEALEVPVREVEAALSNLAESYRMRGLSVQRFREKVQLTTSPSAAVKVERFLGLAAATPLSRAALEALAIVAYQQPVTRPQIEAVRGVNSDSVIKNLLTKGLIEESGRAEGPGRPVLYSTTPEFMQHFGLTSLEELPPLSLPSADRLLNPAHILKG